MSEAEETYCRLCAEQTPKDQLISSNEDVALSSKIATKMLWFNVDISTPSPLPTTICFSCFDLLEKSWCFLDNVRSAQEKLNTIFCPKLPIETIESSESNADNIGKPVNKKWEDFETTKSLVKIEVDEFTTIDPESLLHEIKKEYNSDEDYNELNTALSSDSDVPLKVTAKKKKLKKKKKILDDEEVFEDLIKAENELVPIDGDVSWDEYMCRCAHCDASCKNIQSLRLHSLQIHETCCVFKCSDCGKVINNFRNFIAHVRSHERLLRFFCEYCGLKYTYLKRHIRTSHSNIKQSMCRNCGSTFDNDSMLQEHLLLYAKSIKRSKKRNKGVSERALKCEYCSKEFKSNSNLQQHKLVHSTERKRDYACHICGSMFYAKGTLSTHIMTHEDSRPFKCEFCPLSFRARGNLMSHISLHSDMKPFICDKCGKSFRAKRHLKSHSIMHTDLMPYVCTYCNKQFRFKTRLNLHIRQHTGAKPYTCVHCHRDFTNGSNFKKHMKRRHNIDTSKKKLNNLGGSTNTKTSSIDNDDLKIVTVITADDVQPEEILTCELATASV